MGMLPFSTKADVPGLHAEGKVCGWKQLEQQKVQEKRASGLTLYLKAAESHKVGILFFFLKRCPGPQGAKPVTCCPSGMDSGPQGRGGKLCSSLQAHGHCGCTVGSGH